MNPERRLIDLTRTTPPMPDWVGESAATTLTSLAAKVDLNHLLRNHGFSGFDEHKRAGASWLSQRFLEPIDPDRIVVTNGTQNALFLLLSHLVGRDGILFAEALTYHGLKNYARVIGFQIVGVPMDNEGMLPEALEEYCKERRPNAVFLMPVLQNPTGSVASLTRRSQLIDIARRYDFKIIEDDVYGLLPDEAPSAISAIGPDVAWYTAGLAKCVATGLRVSYIVAPSPTEAHELVLPFRIMSTWFAAPLMAALATEWITDGTANQILVAIREEARLRQSIALNHLGHFDYRSQPVAIHSWLSLPDTWNILDFLGEAERAGVRLYGGDQFSVDPSATPNGIRITIGKPEDRDEVCQALATVAAILLSRE